MTESNAQQSRRDVLTAASGLSVGGLSVASAGTVAAQTAGSLSFSTTGSISSISSSVDLEFVFIDTGTVYTDTHSDASTDYDLSALPESGPFIVYGNETETSYYKNERKYSPGKDQDLTLYFTHTGNISTVNTIFELNDYTGLFPQEDTLLYISQPVSSQFEVVHSDLFGATSTVEAKAEADTRHRIKIENLESGATRDLGVVTPNTDNTYTLTIRPDRATIIEEGAPLIDISPSATTVAASNSTSVFVDVNERDGTLNNWTVTIDYEDGGTSQELFNQTYSNSTTSISPTLALDGKEGGKLNVSVTARTVDGTETSRGSLFDVRSFIDHDRSLLAVLGEWDTQLGGATTFMGVIGAVIVTGGAARQLRLSSESLGLVAIAALLFFAVIGWIPMTLIFGATVTFATLWGVRRGL